MLSVLLRFTDSDYSFCIVKLFLLQVSYTEQFLRNIFLINCCLFNVHRQLFHVYTTASLAISKNYKEMRKVCDNQGNNSWLYILTTCICKISWSLSKYTHFFLFIFWWHQIFSFPFCFSLLVFPTLQWHIYIICSRENHHEKNYF